MGVLPMPAALRGRQLGKEAVPTASPERERPAGYWPGGDTIKVVAMLMVIGIHVISPHFFGQIPAMPPGQPFRFDIHWWIAAAIDSLCRSSVPLFFMVSGALLLPRAEPIAAFLRKRFVAVVVPMVAWSGFYLVWGHQIIHFAGTPPLSALPRQPAFFHLWFLYPLLLSYLAMPLMRVVFAQGGRLVGYALVLWGLAVAWMFADNLAAGNPEPGVLWPDYPYYLGYVLLGGALLRFRDRVPLWAAGGLFGLSAAATLLLTYVWSARLGTASEQFMGYFAPNVAVGAVAAFLFLDTLSLRLGRAAQAAIRFLGGLSFGVYAVHPVVILYFIGDTRTWFSNPSLIALAGIATVVLGAGAIALVLSRIPLLRRLV
ncbi:hypothetical protein DM194_27295 (plasmid) [Azospirillum ramasamyi]|uniref:Acyltransferase 3 domain-containing protein n=1 Tax=Azospirillum ramasamyi TaxID=682998 RepID=A0A2U9SEM9_9PROT|nr:hypothetical protein DM194_27295 [Azospirillum ramasamyi]